VHGFGLTGPLTTSGPCAWIAEVLRTLVIFAAIAFAICARFAFG
jgi:hypothetical protein